MSLKDYYESVVNIFSHDKEKENKRKKGFLKKERNNVVEFHDFDLFQENQGNGSFQEDHVKNFKEGKRSKETLDSDFSETLDENLENKEDKINFQTVKEKKTSVFTTDFVDDETQLKEEKLVKKFVEKDNESSLEAEILEKEEDLKEEEAEFLSEKNIINEESITKEQKVDTGFLAENVDTSTNNMIDKSLSKVDDTTENKDQNLNEDSEKYFTKKLTEKEKQVLNEHLSQMKTVNGYKGSAIIDIRGGVIAQDLVDNSIEMDFISAILNDIFVNAHRASREIEFGSTKDLSIDCEHGTIIMRCSGEHSEQHFHLIAILDKNGNRSLMDIRMKQALPKIMKDLS